MFVAMGLSAVVPVLHGVKLYGLSEIQQRIGLSWLLLQGFLYILGAALYAVSDYYYPERRVIDKYRLAGQSELLQGCLIYGEVPIKSSTC